MCETSQLLDPHCYKKPKVKGPNFKTWRNSGNLGQAYPLTVLLLNRLVLLSISPHSLVQCGRHMTIIGILTGHNVCPSKTFRNSIPYTVWPSHNCCHLLSSPTLYRHIIFFGNISFVHLTWTLTLVGQNHNGLSCLQYCSPTGINLPAHYISHLNFKGVAHISTSAEVPKLHFAFVLFNVYAFKRKASRCPPLTIGPETSRFISSSALSDFDFWLTHTCHAHHIMDFIRAYKYAPQAIQANTQMRSHAPFAAPWYKCALPCWCHLNTIHVLRFIVNLFLFGTQICLVAHPRNILCQTRVVATVIVAPLAYPFKD